MSNILLYFYLEIYYLPGHTSAILPKQNIGSPYVQLFHQTWISAVKGAGIGSCYTSP